MRRSITVAVMVVAALMAFPTAVWASTHGQAPNHQFNTNYTPGQFGQPTTFQVAPQTPQNVRVDHNAAYFPPSAGIYSGEFPTDATNPYITQDRWDAAVSQIHTPRFGLIDGEQGGNVTQTGSQQFLPSTSVDGSGGSTSNGSTGVQNPGGNVTITNRPNFPQNTYQPITSVSRFSDGRIATLHIPAIGLTADVRDGVSDSTMRHYVGHFSWMSEWDGNVGLASHNRGQGSFFNGIWNLRHGDRVEYTTTLGTRHYEVFNIVDIHETDMSYQNHTHDNILTMITCLANRPERRWVVQARQI